MLAGRFDLAGGTRHTGRDSRPARGLPPGSLRGAVRAHRAALLLLWLVLWPALLASLRRDDGSPLSPVARVAAIAGLLATGVALAFAGRGPRRALLGSLAVVAAITFLPERDEPGSLRSIYVQAMESDEGVAYAAGFEGKPGLNCSGLVRGSLTRVDLLLGLEHLDPGLLRDGLQLWIHHCSANDLQTDCDGELTPLLTATSIDDIDDSQLQPGDVAVTRDRPHCLAYVGSHQWIDADPDARRVVRERVPARSHWFHVPVLVLRWNQLSDLSPVIAAAPARGLLRAGRALLPRLPGPVQRRGPA